MAPVPVVKSAREVEAGLLSTDRADPMPPSSSKEKPRRGSVAPRNMAPGRRLALALAAGLLIGILLALSWDSAASRCFGFLHRASGREPGAAVPAAAGGGLTDKQLSGSPDLLHRLLQAYSPQHGSHRTAKHADEPELGTTMAQMAKRQNGGNNATSASPPATSSDQKPSEPPTSQPSQSDSKPPGQQLRLGP